MSRLDPKLNPFRPDLAAAHLRGQVEAARFVEGVPRRVIAPSAHVQCGPDAKAQMTSELLFGEAFTVYESDGVWAWGQAEADNYVGWVQDTALGDAGAEPGHRVGVLRTPLFDWPDLKAPVTGFLHRNALVHVQAQDDHYADTGQGWVHVPHLRILDTGEADPVAVALQYMGAPYVWGGKTSLGLDCSALVQMAHRACGSDLPRDSVDQEQAVKEQVPVTDDLRGLQRGDLVFWKGHVGMMEDADMFLHANAHHMMVAHEPLARAVARIQKTAGPITSIRRPVI